MANLPVPSPRTFGVSEIETAGNLNSLRDAVTFALNPPILSVTQTTVQTLTTGVWTAISMDATVVDSYGMHSNVTNNTRATAIVVGWYLVSGAVAFAASATGTRGARFAVNGSVVQATAQFGPPTAAGSLAIAAVSKLIFLNVGDYVEIQGVQNSGGNLNTLMATDLDSSLTLDWRHV